MVDPHRTELCDGAQIRSAQLRTADFVAQLRTADFVEWAFRYTAPGSEDHFGTFS